MGVKERRAREKEQLQRQIPVAARELFVNDQYEIDTTIQDLQA